MHVDTASLTSKGQFTIERKFRELLGVGTGSKFVVVCDGTHLLLKPIKGTQVGAFRKVIEHADRLTEKAEALSKESKKRGAK